VNATIAVPDNAEAGTFYTVTVSGGVNLVAESYPILVGEGPAEVQPTATPDAALFDSTVIYLVAIGDAGQRGLAFGCDDSLVPLRVEIEPTVAPLTAALNEIFSSDDRTYANTDLYNPFYNSDVSIQGIDITDGVAEIALTGELNIGGACDVPRIESVIEQTALRFRTVDSVEVTLNGNPLAAVLNPSS
jgi:hypothetical protein